jgi:PIN domain nuclease of toxin-antitoxin system
LKVLLDTQICRWFVVNARRLSCVARRVLDDAEAVFVSAASVWEAAIKASMGKLDVHVPDLASEIDASGFQGCQ